MAFDTTYLEQFPQDPRAGWWDQLYPHFWDTFGNFFIWLWVKNMYPTWSPGKWKHGLKILRSGSLTLAHALLGASSLGPFLYHSGVPFPLLRRQQPSWWPEPSLHPRRGRPPRCQAQDPGFRDGRQGAIDGDWDGES